MGCYYNQYHRENVISWIFHQVNSKDGVDFAMLFTLAEQNVKYLPLYKPEI